MALSKKNVQQITAFSFGVVFIIVMLVIALFFEDVSAFQFLVFRVVLALAASGVAAMIPGFIEVRFRKTIMAGGAIAVFVIVFFLNPAILANPSVYVEIAADPEGWGSEYIIYNPEIANSRDLESIKEIDYLEEKNRFRIFFHDGHSKGWFIANHFVPNGNGGTFRQLKYLVNTYKIKKTEMVEFGDIR